MKKIILILVIAILTVFFLTSCHNHEFSQRIKSDEFFCSYANCTNASTYFYSCECGEKGEETFEVGESLGHRGGKATCTEKAICGVCKEEYGELEKHMYTEQIIDETYFCAEATCSQAATYYLSCICGEKSNKTFESGAALGHTGGTATCSQKAICDICKEEYGETLEHTFSEWEIKTKASVSAIGTLIQYCTECDYSNTKSYQLDSYIENNKFIFTVDEFRNMFYNNFDNLSSDFGGALNRTKEGQAVIDIRDVSYANVGNIGFVVDKNTWTMASDKTDACFDGMIMMVNRDAEFVANAMISFVKACYPSITEYEARTVCRDLTSGATTHDGVYFTLNITGNTYMITAVVSE